MKIEQIINDFALDNGIIIGICSADRLDYLDNTDVCAPFVGFEKEERINPKAVMPKAKSVIVVGAGYRKRELYQIDNEKRASFSIGAHGLDYHKNLHGILANLKEVMLNRIDFESMIFVDTGPLIEREFAKKAGLGQQGKNGNVISAKFGSFFNIGIMLVDIELKPSPGYAHDDLICGRCEACIKACPPKALSEKGFNYNKCITFLTQSKKTLTKEEMLFMGDSLYGCDICQNVCRFNENKYCDETIKNIDEIRPRIDDILRLTNKQFHDKYSTTSIYWRGKRVLQRNALIALENSKNTDD